MEEIDKLKKEIEQEQKALQDMISKTSKGLNSVGVKLGSYIKKKRSKKKK